MAEALVIFECVQVGSKLRVRPTAASAREHGLLPGANTQFPRNLREPGRRFAVPTTAITVGRVGTSETYFYRVRAAAIQPHEPAAAGAEAALPECYGERTDECCICMDTVVGVVFGPCGHFVSCVGCAARLQECPMCRGPIAARIDPARFA